MNKHFTIIKVLLLAIPIAVFSLFAWHRVGDLFVVTSYAIANSIIKTGHLKTIEMNFGWYRHYNLYVNDYPLSGILISVISWITGLDEWFVAWLPITGIAVVIIVYAAVMFLMKNNSKLSKVLHLLTPLTSLALPLNFSCIEYHGLSILYIIALSYIISINILKGKARSDFNNTLYYLPILILSIATSLTHYRAEVIVFFLLLLFSVLNVSLNNSSTKIYKSMNSIVALTIPVILVISIQHYFIENYIMMIGNANFAELIFNPFSKKESIWFKYNYYINSKYATLTFLLNLSASLIIRTSIVLLLFTVVVLLMQRIFANIGLLSEKRSLLASEILLFSSISSIYIAGIFYRLVYGYLLIEPGYTLVALPSLITALYTIKLATRAKLLKFLAKSYRLFYIIIMVLVLLLITYAIISIYSYFFPMRSVWLKSSDYENIFIGEFISSLITSNHKIYADFSLSAYIAKTLYEHSIYDKNVGVRFLADLAFILYENPNILSDTIRNGILIVKLENYKYGLWGDIGKWFIPPLKRDILYHFNIIFNNNFTQAVIIR